MSNNRFTLGVHLCVCVCMSPQCSPLVDVVAVVDITNPVNDEFN